MLEVLDLERCGQVFSVQPATGWADEYSFEVNAEEWLTALNVEHKGLGRFTYAASGDLQDAQTSQAAQLERGDYGTRLMAARDLLKTAATPDNARKALNAADTALTDGAKDRPTGALSRTGFAVSPTRCLANCPRRFRLSSWPCL